MALGIYKPGQGYWVRVMTAVFAGVIVLAAAAWMWQQAALVASKIPASGHQYNVSSSQGEPRDGMSIELLMPDPNVAGSTLIVGTGRLEVSGPLSGSLMVGKLSLREGRDASQASTLREAGGGAFRADVTPIAPRQAFPPLYLQAGAASVVILIGSIGIFYFVGSKPSSSEFLIATDGEMKKVNWSTRREVIGSTWVVVVASFLIAAVLFAIDFAFSRFFHLIGVLEQ